MENFQVLQAAIDKAFKNGVFNTQEASQVLTAMANVSVALQTAQETKVESKTLNKKK